ncbi:MAG TPA: hypothetical protein VF082_11055 [Jiangellaceae bacterium]
MTDPRPTPDDLERLPLGAPKRYPREDVAGAVAVPVEEAAPGTLPPRDVRVLGRVTPYAVSRRPAVAGRPAVRG